MYMIAMIVLLGRVTANTLYIIVRCVVANALYIIVIIVLLGRVAHCT